MFHLQLFNLDEQGEEIGIVHLGGPYESVSGAITGALHLRLGTHFRITDDHGHLILGDCPLAANEDAAAELLN